MSSDSASAEDQTKDFQQQVDTYIAWVNSQLKKRTGTKPVKDLKTDFNDGVVLANLVEIISSEKLDGVKNPASKIEEKQHNINLVLSFLKFKNIRMHHITDWDIIDGNVKSLMRLILTLAAHFKPSSVGSKKSVTAAVASANVTLGDMHRRVTSSGGYYRSRWKSSTPSENRRHTSGSSHSKGGFNISNQSDPARTASADDSFTLNKLPSSGEVFSSPSLSDRRKQKRSDNAFSCTPIRNLSSINSEVIISSGGDGGSLSIAELTECYADMEHDLSSTKEMISLLQNLLLNGENPDQNDTDLDEKCPPLEASSVNDECVILRSQLDLCQHESDRLKTELSDVRQECRSLSAGKSALQTRTQQQDKDLISSKQQILKLNLANETLKKDNEALSGEVDELKRASHALSQDLSDKNMTIKHLKDEISNMSTQLKRIGDESKHKLNSVQQLEAQVQELRHQIRVLQRYKQPGVKANGNEKKVITESLNSLRANIPPHDSRQHILDTLEQAVMSLTEQVSRPDAVSYRTNELSRVSATYSPRSRKRDSVQKTPATTVIYFTERNMTPSRAAIYKRIGDITLRDFKNILHTSSDNYKYNFKALDPEFGTVKKEVFEDDEIVPGWEGKIVAWLEKEPTNGHT